MAFGENIPLIRDIGRKKRAAKQTQMTGVAENPQWETTHRTNAQGELWQMEGSGPSFEAGKFAQDTRPSSTDFLKDSRTTKADPWKSGGDTSQ